ncbi:MAG: cadherin-like beta sandwich domain-containing protein [Saccharospirillum sp.]|uniref:beta strand repeat-containing protein n=1 Tax=Saccharospirillum sp. TaxID=2033801 RepID=UPI0032999CAC
MLAVLFDVVACSDSGNKSDTSASNDATLAELTVSAGTISPAFAPGTTDYTVITGKDSSTVTAIPTQANATVTISGTASSGAASSPIELDAGETELTVTVTAPDGTSSQVYTVMIARVISFELLDPTPGATDRFGSKVVILGNGNIVVSDPQDSSRFAVNGAVHLYSPFSSTPIASLYGDAGGDRLGSTSITALPNGNYVVTSKDDNENGVVEAGSVRLVDGRSGIQIGSALTGDSEYDNLGSGSVTALGNDYYIVASEYDDVNGIEDAGSVRLMDGNTGIQIGSAITGNVEFDYLGTSSITALPNNNYVIASSSDTENGIVSAGSVRLVDGSTGIQIGSTLAGDVANDALGSSSITALANGHYVIASGSDDENGVVNAGSVRLVDGSTGMQIGSTLSGGVEGDALGASSVTALPNSHFVVVSRVDDENGVVNAGSVRLIDGSTGEQIGNALVGDVANDRLGSGGVTVLPNGHYVIASINDDENGVVNAGSVRLVNGITGVQIGSTSAGDDTSDALGATSITALPNSHYVVASQFDDENSIIDAGSVRLFDGSTGVQIGSALAGDVGDDSLGSGGITVLSNGHYIVASSEFDDENGIVDAGSVRLVDGNSGVQIGSTLAGDENFDAVGSGGITPLPTGNYVVASDNEDVSGIFNAGVVRLLDGTTGLQLGSAIVGSTVNDLFEVFVVSPGHGVFYIMSTPYADKNGQTDAGMVRVVVP